VTGVKFTNPLAQNANAPAKGVDFSRSLFPKVQKDTGD